MHVHGKDGSPVAEPLLSVKPHFTETCNNRHCVREGMRLGGELKILWEMRKAEIQQVVQGRDRGFLAYQLLPRKLVECCWILKEIKLCFIFPRNLFSEK